MQYSVSVYLHWPFCESKCPYCDFNSHVREEINEQLFVESYLKELSFYSEYLNGKRIKSVFFGGGTPSLAPISFFDEVLSYLSSVAHMQSDAEITIEANPGSLDTSRFGDFISAGVNRISIGAQSFSEKSLQFLGRKHSVASAVKAIECAAGAFKNYSFDLIYALPWHDLEIWRQELEIALSYAKYHLSIYQLTIEKGTQFFHDYNLKKFALPEEELAADLYLLTNELLQQNDFEVYEVSNYARSGYQCQHNLSYWEYCDYIGIGAGAHGRITQGVNKVATMNYHSPEKWLSLLQSGVSPAQYHKQLSAEEAWHERVIMGLRMQKGLPLSFIAESAIEQGRIQKMLELELLEIAGGNVRATNKGMLTLNGVLRFLLN